MQYMLKRLHLWYQGKVVMRSVAEGCRFLELGPCKVSRREWFTCSLSTKLVYMQASCLSQLLCLSVKTEFNLMPVVPNRMM